MELLGSGVMRVASGDDAGATWAARVGREIGVLEGEAGLGKGVDIGGFDGGMAVRATVIPVHIIGNDEDEIWPIRSDEGTDEGEKKNKSEHGSRRCEDYFSMASLNLEFAAGVRA